MNEKTYKHIRIAESTIIKDTYDIFQSKSKDNKDIIGSIYYHARWRSWVFQPVDDLTIWSTSCLKDVINFIEELEKN